LLRQNSGERAPASCREHHLQCQSIQIIGFGPNHGCARKIQTQAARLGEAVCGDLLNSLCDLWLIAKEAFEVPEDESIFMYRFQREMPDQPDVIEGNDRIGRVGDRLDPILKPFHQPVDNLLLGLEMVVEVAGADSDFRCDAIDRYLDDAVGVEQHQTGCENSVSRAVGATPLSVGLSHGRQGA
jgi:hypothetical protein